MIRPDDTHFPITCGDLIGGAIECCLECHRDEDELPFYAIVEDDAGRVVSALNIGQPAVGYSCCERVADVRAAVIRVIGEHVLDHQVDCPQCKSIEARR